MHGNDTEQVRIERRNYDSNLRAIFRSGIFLLNFGKAINSFAAGSKKMRFRDFFC